MRCYEEQINNMIFKVESGEPKLVNDALNEITSFISSYTSELRYNFKSTKEDIEKHYRIIEKLEMLNKAISIINTKKYIKGCIDNM